MSNSDEFYAVKCILKYAWAKADYNRYLAFDDKQVPYLAYTGQTDYPYNVAKFTSEEEAIKSLKEALSIEIPKDLAVSDRINIIMVRNNNKYQVVQCKIDDNILVELSKTNIAELDRHW